jgi:hypothetical protein
MPGMALTPASPWHPAQDAAAALPAASGSGAAAAFVAPTSGLAGSRLP